MVSRYVSEVLLVKTQSEVSWQTHRVQCSLCEKQQRVNSQQSNCQVVSGKEYNNSVSAHRSTSTFNITSCVSGSQMTSYRRIVNLTVPTVQYRQSMGGHLTAILQDLHSDNSPGQVKTRAGDNSKTLALGSKSALKSARSRLWSIERRHIQ